MNCPECHQAVSPQALMCGFCERSLPRRRFVMPHVPLGWVGAVLAVAALITYLATRPAATASPEELQAGVPRMRTLLAGSQLSDDDLDFMYRQVRGIMRRHGLTISAPLTTNWVPLDVIKSKSGPDTMGFTQAVQFAEGSTAGIEVFIPTGQSPVTTLHIMAHELGHCWHLDNRVLHAPKALTEGFGEWIAWHTLSDLDVTDEGTRREIADEIAQMKKNGHREYSDGLMSLQALEEKGGSDAVFAEMLKTR